MKSLNDSELINQFQKRLFDTYKAENLTSLSGLQEEYTIDGENILGSYMDAMRGGQKLYSNDLNGLKPMFDYNRIMRDLFLLSDEILHYTGLTIFYSKELANPLVNPIYLQTGAIEHALHQTIYDRRFYMYATSSYEKLYNYWDRIGDLLASFFPENIKPSKVFFAKIDKFIPEEFQTESSVKWLVSFKNNEYQLLNNKRIKVVHYENFDTNFFSNFLDNSDNPVKIKKLIESREAIIPDLKIQMKLTLDGFVNSIRFMEYLNQNILNDPSIIEIKKQAIALLK